MPTATKIDQTIEKNYYNPNVGRATGGYNVYSHGTYGSNSVLAGQPMRSWLNYFDTLEEAQATYPYARVIDGTTRREGNPLPACPPSDFDPADCGELWDDDY